MGGACGYPNGDIGLFCIGGYGSKTGGDKCMISAYKSGGSDVVSFLIKGFENVIGTVSGGGDGFVAVRYISCVLGIVFNEFSFIAGDGIELKELLGVISCSFDCYENSNE